MRTQTETSKPTPTGSTTPANRPARPNVNPARPNANEPRLTQVGEDGIGITTRESDRVQGANRDLQVVREFERSLIDMERRMDRALRGFTGEGGLRYPLLQGLALQEGAGELFGFRPFGSLVIDEQGVGYREPLLTWTVNDEQTEAQFRIEVPGLDKSDLKLQVTPDRIHIEGSHGDTRYRAECIPGIRLEPNQAHATYKAGVLSLKIGLERPDEALARDVAVL